MHRRLYEYRRPTKGNEQEYRIHEALISARTAELWIYTDGDMSNKTTRCRLERGEIEMALKGGMQLLNNDGPDDAAHLEAKVRFHEKEAAAARAKLAALQK